MAENVMISSDVRGFSKVWLSSSSDVKISIGQNFSVVMTGDEEKIANTTLVRQRDTLIIKSKNKNHNYDRDQLMLVTIVMPNIEEMKINGSGNVHITGVDSEELDLAINGSGDISVQGQSEGVDFAINGSGDVDADKVQCIDVDVDILGSGDSSVYASNSINFDSSGSGRVDVFGKPKSVYDKKVKRKSSLLIH